MPSFGGLLIVVAIAFAAPFALGLFPGLRLPSIVLEIVAGIVVGPSVLGWVQIDTTITVISTMGLGFLLFLGGLEVDFARLPGPVLRLTALGYLVSFAIAVVVAFALKAGGLVDTPLLVAITFAAGAILSLVDGDRVMTNPQLRRKLEATGFGLFIPVFFVASGVRYDLGALFQSVSTVAMVPMFVLALLVVRGVPALLYRRLLGARQALVAALLQATSLPFIVAATAIGLELGLIDAAGSAALIGGGLLSVVVFPVTGLALLRGGASPAVPAQTPATTDEPIVAM